MNLTYKDEHHSRLNGNYAVQVTCFKMLCVGGGLPTQDSIAGENIFQNGKRNEFIRQTKIEKINYQLTCATRNAE